MNTKSRRLLVLIPWMLLPLLVGGYLTVWGELPARLAVHFDAAGTPNGWMGRGTFLVYAAVFLAMELGVFTLVLTTKFKELAPPPLMVAFYFFMAGEAALLWQVVIHNARGTGIGWLWVLAAALTASFIPAVVMLTARRRG